MKHLKILNLLLALAFVGIIFQTNKAILLNFRFNNSILFLLMFLILLDITFRILIIYRIKRLKQKHDVTYSLLTRIINNIPFVICLKDTNGKILLVNNEFKKVSQLTNKELIGKESSSFYIESQHSIDDDSDIRQTKKCKISERQIKLKKGLPDWYRTIKIPVLDSQKKMKYIVEIFENIQSQKDIEIRKETFVATLTHDLKTPTLSQIKGLELLLNNSLGGLNDIQRNIINQVKNSCYYMSGLIFTILDTYMYENGQIVFEPKEFNFTDLVNETINETSNLLEEKNLSITVESGSSENIIADRSQIKRVIANILSNAITYGDKHTVIEVHISKTNSNILMDIKNKSPYIPEEKLKDIFEKFKTTSNAKFRKTGLGLGLYISKQIIDAHKGEIHATSEKNGTCTFGFSIPLIPAA